MTTAHDLMSAINAKIDADKRETGIITLGELIDALSTRPRDHQVRFDFGSFVPRGVDSYRGYYSDLAIGYDDDWRKPQSLGALLDDLRASVGKVFTGYKGGEYTMTRSTVVWAANYGQSNQTATVGVTGNDYQTVLVTKWVD